VEAAREDRPATISSPAEQDFMMKASQANLSEINMSRLALQKTDNTDVRDYANMIQSDHTHALEDLTDLMQDKNVTQTKTLAPETKQDIDNMSRLTGPEFDREYVNMMVADHQKAVELFRDQAASALDPDVKKLVDNTLPTLEMHLEKAQRLQSRLFNPPRS
jgi:putative membrane protein